MSRVCVSSCVRVSGCVSCRVELSLFKEQPWPPTVPVNCPVASDNNITQVLDGEDKDVDASTELFRRRYHDPQKTDRPTTTE